MRILFSWKKKEIDNEINLFTNKDHWKLVFQAALYLKKIYVMISAQAKQSESG